MESLFHYCSTNSFVEIIKSKKIRLSSLSHSNDYLEGKLISRVFERLCDRDSLSPFIKRKLLDKLNELDGGIEGLAFCLSTEEDLLSQWRGYADDGRGVAIGFSRDAIESLTRSNLVNQFPLLQLEQVLYTDEEHENALLPAYQELKRLIEMGALQGALGGGLFDLGGAKSGKPEQRALDDEAYKKLFLMYFNLYKLKSQAFKEECEWRLIYPLIAKQLTEHLVYAKPDRIIPFIEAALPMGKGSITKILLGPKHQSDPVDIQRTLFKFGFGMPEVIRSKASYR